MPHDEIYDHIYIVAAIVVKPFPDDCHRALRIKREDVLLFALFHTEVCQRRREDRLIKAFKCLLRIEQVILLMNDLICLFVLLDEIEVSD